MLSSTDDSLYPVSANEPKVHPLVRRSFAFVPTVGMRHAPEILVIEFYREVFWEHHYGATGAKELDPDDINDDKSYYYTAEERAVLYTLRGRRRKTKNSKTNPFFAPAYPSLAREAWLRQKSDRVINKLLLRGAIAQYLWGGGETEDKKREQEKFADTLMQVLVGHNSCRDNDPRGKDILSVALRNTPSEDPSEENRDEAKKKIQEETCSDTVMKLPDDELAGRIYKDLLAICELEKRLPRMQWLQVLMTFLRFSMPMWLLAQMRITSLLHHWLIDVIDRGKQVNSIHIENEISRRNRGLLHPSRTPTREIFEKIEQYMKKRVELNILLYLLGSVRASIITNKRLEIQGAGSTVLTVEQLLQTAREAIGDMKSSNWFREKARDGNFQDFLIRMAEQHSAWRDPRKAGQGKNIDEFFRVLYRDDLGDEVGGYLLLSEGRGRTRGFRVFPGQLLLKTISFLAAHDKHTNSVTKGGGKLVLEEVENHFQQYGIDFSYAADARPLLMRELQAMGLLTGSPDAGSSVAVACPY